MRRRISTSLISLLAGLTVTQFQRVAEAKEFFQFSDTSVSALTGWGYELTGNHLSAVTFENSNAWIGGDFYGFVDFRNQHDHASNTHSWYGEASPRFSLSKIAGLDFGDGIVKDILVATTWERGEDGNESVLLGAGLTLDFPGFSFFKANLYARKDKSRGAGFDDMQLTFAWGYPFELGKYSFVLSGISDYVFGWGPRARNFHLVPQLKLDVGALYDKPRKYYLGLEFDYWKNQFGVENTTSLDSNQLGVVCCSGSTCEGHAFTDSIATEYECPQIP